MPVTYTEYPEKARVEFTVSGHLYKADYDAVVVPLQAFIEQHGTIQMVEVVESFAGFDPAVLFPGVQFDFRHIQNIRHAAIVTDIGWMSPIVQATSMVLPTHIRCFPLAERAAAHAWLDSERENDAA